MRRFWNWNCELEPRRSISCQSVCRKSVQNRVYYYTKRTIIDHITNMYLNGKHNNNNTTNKLIMHTLIQLTTVLAICPWIWIDDNVFWNLLRLLVKIGVGKFIIFAWNTVPKGSSEISWSASLSHGRSGKLNRWLMSLYYTSAERGKRETLYRWKNKIGFTSKKV